MWLYGIIHKGKIPTLSDMALKQRLKTAQMATNDTKMGWNCDREEEKLINSVKGGLQFNSVCVLYLSTFPWKSCQNVIRF